MFVLLFFFFFSYAFHFSPCHSRLQKRFLDGPHNSSRRNQLPGGGNGKTCRCSCFHFTFLLSFHTHTHTHAPSILQHTRSFSHCFGMLFAGSIDFAGPGPPWCCTVDHNGARNTPHTHRSSCTVSTRSCTTTCPRPSTRPRASSAFR